VRFAMRAETPVFRANNKIFWCTVRPKVFKNLCSDSVCQDLGLVSNVWVLLYGISRTVTLPWMVFLLKYGMQRINFFALKDGSKILFFYAVSMHILRFFLWVSLQHHVEISSKRQMDHWSGFCLESADWEGS
jgi:hypothetical protein